MTVASETPMPVALPPPADVPGCPVITRSRGGVGLVLRLAVATIAFCRETPPDEPVPVATIPPVPLMTMPPSDSTVVGEPVGPNTDTPVAPVLLPVPPVPLMVRSPMVETSVPTVSIWLPMITPTALPPELPADVPPVPLRVTAVPLPPTCAPLLMITPDAPCVAEL